MSKCDFNKVAKQVEIALRLGCFLVNLLHIFRRPFTKNTPGSLLLKLFTASFANPIFIFSPVKKLKTSNYSSH